MPGHDRHEQHTWTGSQARALLVTSLGERTGTDPVQLGVAAIALVAPILVSAVFFNLDSTVVKIGTAAVTLPLIFVALNSTEKLVAALATRKLLRVGHGFDASHYLGLMSLPHHDARLVVQLRLAKSWPDDRRQASIDATKRSVPTLENVRFESNGQVLRLESKELATRGSVMSHSSPVRFFTNRPLHDCFTAILRTVVPTVTATCTIQKIEADVAGKVASGDEP